MSGPESYAKKVSIVKSHIEKNGVNFEKHIENDLRKLPAFSELLDIKKASESVRDAIVSKKKIGLYGDYDADGSTSVALFYTFLKMLGCTALTYQPSRFVEGYGLHVSSIQKAIEDGVELLITFDCGIMNHESAEFAKNSGLPLIITDHHNDGSKEIPCALAVVNPNRSDQPESDLKKLAGVGVSFALAHEVKKLFPEAPSIYELLQFVAIGTVGDMVPMNPMNAKLVRHGLHQFPTTKLEGIKALFSLCELPYADTEFIGFKIAPMINAKGRLETAEESLTLLKSSDRAEAMRVLQSLVSTNEDRKKIQSSNQIIVTNKIKKHQLALNKIMVVYHEKLHQGVIGLLASNIIHEYGRPAIVMTKDTGKKGILKASVRSVGDFDIFKFLSSLEFPFVSFGGHKKASGFSILEEDFDRFKSLVEERSKEMVIEPLPDPEIAIDPTMIDMELAKVLHDTGPFGEGNKRPNFVFEVDVTDGSVIKQKHLKLFCKEIRGGVIFFNYFKDDGDAYIPQGRIRISAQVGMNSFNGNINLSLVGQSLQVLSKTESKVAVTKEKYVPDDIEF